MLGNIKVYLEKTGADRAVRPFGDLIHRSVVVLSFLDDLVLVGLGDLL